MDKLNLTFKSEQILNASDMNSITEKVNELVDSRLKTVQQTGSSVTLKPNTYNIWKNPIGPEFKIDNLTFEGEAEYILEFTVQENVDSVAFTNNQNVKWFGGKPPKFQAGKTYVISIVNNLAVGGEFANE